MSVWVMKFGGTSVANPDLIRNASARIRERRAEGRQVVVVVSAMGDTTDRLLAAARAISPTPPRRELDVLLSAGEVQSMALLVMALAEDGVDAVSLTGGQGGIETDDRHSEARIRRVSGDRIRDALADDQVVVIAGFQGVTAGAEITTLGRGGSDTSAVAIAAALDAERCEILTDVSGVFTADPRVVPDAHRIERLSYDEMLEMATLGSRVLHRRAVELAHKFEVPLTVAHAVERSAGTRIESRDHEEESGVDERSSMEAVVVRGISTDAAVSKVSLIGVPDEPGVAAKIFAQLGTLGVRAQLIVQAQSHEGANDITFVVADDATAGDRPVESWVNSLIEGVAAQSTLVDREVGLLSVVGEGITREPGVPGRVFEVLAAEGINIDLISTSNLVITCVVPLNDLDRGARALHAALISPE